MARTPLDQRLTELENHPKSAFLQEINRVVYAYLDGPPKRTLAAIAKTIGYSPAALTKWLTGENPIGPNECHKLCQTIGLDEQQIAGLLDLGDYEQRVVIRPTVFLSEAGLRRQHEVEQAAQHQWQEEERRVRLQTFISPYNHRFFDERRADFVGRTAELGEVRQRIEALRATGGYLAIAGPAGEGKSSLVAELIQQYGEPTTAYHFIPFSPGADEQINLLQSLLAKLLLKHNLLDHADGYIPMNAQIPTLCNSLQYLFDQLHQLGVQEVIFIDGLDQIKPDLRIGERDLSFLPLQLPPGIVIVIGTRPDDTLKPLELRAPLSSYPLPPLSPNDFAELLIHRQADLSPDQRTALYTALHGNAFDLDFAAKLIAMTPETKLNALLNTVKRNPRHLFGLALDRLKRDSTWHQAIKPVLGCLLATTLSEPMTEDGICAATGLEADQVSEALLKLGGLLKMVDHNGRAIYYLYHLKLIDYLQDAVLPPGQKIFHRDEICSSHARLAAWCESSPSGLAAIWQDATGNSAEQERRAYARQHYILHLAAAQQWDKLWAVLDEGSYGKAKLQHDPSTRSYALDLDMGRQAAAREEWEFEEGLARLPNLWRYSLLRCSLASQADKYPDEVFRAMARLSRAQEAIGMAELISDPHRKASVLMQIGVQLGQQAGRDREGGQVLLRAGEVAHTIAQAGERAAVLGAVAVALAQAGLAAEASRMAHAIADTWPRTQAFGDVATALAQRGEHTMAAALLTKATDLAHTMADRGQHAPALRAVAMGWSRMGQAAEAREVAGAIGDDRERAAALRDVAGALAQTGQKRAAIDLARTIGDDGQRARALAAVAVALAGERVVTGPLLAEAAAVARTIAHAGQRAVVFRDVARALAQTGQERAAIDLARTIGDDGQRARALAAVAVALMQAGQATTALPLLDEATAAVRAIEMPWVHAGALAALAVALARAGLAAEATDVARAIVDDRDYAAALRAVAVTLARVGLAAQAGEAARAIAMPWARAGALAAVAEALAHVAPVTDALPFLAEAINTVSAIGDDGQRAAALAAVVGALASVGQWVDAIDVARTIADDGQRAGALRAVAEALASTGHWVEASELARVIMDDGQRAAALASARQEMETITVAQAIVGDQNRAWALAAVAWVLASARQEMEAITVAQAIVGDQNRAWALAAMAKAYKGQAVAAFPLLTIASEAARAIASAGERAKALAVVAEALANIGAAAARPLLTEATAVARAIADEQERTGVLPAVAEALASVGQWAEATDVARAIVDDWQRAVALAVVAQTWAGAGEPMAAIPLLAEATAVAHTIADDQNRSWALEAVAPALARARQWTEATAVAGAIEDAGKRAATLRAVAEALAQVGQWMEATTVAHTIEFPWQRVMALRTVAEALAQARQVAAARPLLTEATETARTITDDWQRAEALRMVAEVLASAGQAATARLLLTEATEAARVIANAGDRARALAAVAVALGQAGPRDQLLRLVQQSWLEANTKGYLLDILPMATGLIAVKPEIGVAFADAFVWVDDFFHS